MFVRGGEEGRQEEKEVNREGRRREGGGGEAGHRGTEEERSKGRERLDRFGKSCRTHIHLNNPGRLNQAIRMLQSRSPCSAHVVP